jgi:plastocyanin
MIMIRKIVTFILLISIIMMAAACATSTTTTPGGTTGSTGTTAGTSTTDTTATASTTGNNNKISIKSFAFNPQVLTVTVGTPVIWTNEDATTHKIKSATFNSGDLAQGDTYEFTFNTKGTFDYSCAIHPTMTGQIVVK